MNASLTRRGLLGAAASLALAPAFAAPSASLHDDGAAPEFAGIERWFNSPPLTMAALRGRVVLVDFWTYGCINCLHTLPFINRWARDFAGDGLVVVGVHTPEFAFERSAANLQAAMERFGVKHPVAQDNRYATWRAYDNQYWPAHYLVDRNGRIQYKHFGEGEYERTEATLRALLARPKA